jgi:general secretion pathway protein E
MLEQQATKLLPFEFARVNRVLIDNERQQLLIAPAAPLWAVAEVNRISGKLPIGNLTETEFDALLSEIYSGRSGTSEAVMEDIKDFVDMESAAADLEEVSDLLDAENDDAPIVRLLNAILTESLKENASDIHIEPYEREALVRFRLDGVLRTVLSPSVQIAPLLISRIKVMSKLDIAEKRLPQDGRMSVLLGGRSIDLRVSTMPSSHGERVVMRLLDKDAGKLQAQQLGMPEATENELDELISRPHGIILVTGPTGSGKTTTLYAALQQMDRKQRNIMTVEDPVEYDLPGVSQTQINLRAGMTFARGLRAILRQDPDVILIGEIRDGETAEIATQASLTGHLVLSTLHTNTAAGAITRLQDLGVDSFLLASTVRGIISQRLMRKLCTHCREEVVVDDYQRSLLNVPKDFSIYKSKGCEACNNTGFSGRQALFELVTVDASLQSLIHEDTGELELEQAIRKTVPSIREAGFELVRQGKTTIEEVIRVTSV